MESSQTVTKDMPDGGPSGEPLLEANGVTKRFGGLTAVDDVSFSIPERSIVSIIGPNGAGKTTFFNMLTGLYKPTLGTVTFDGKNVTTKRPDQITALRSHGRSRTSACSARCRRSRT